MLIGYAFVVVDQFEPRISKVGSFDECMTRAKKYLFDAFVEDSEEYQEALKNFEDEHLFCTEDNELILSVCRVEG